MPNTSHDLTLYVLLQGILIAIRSDVGCPLTLFQRLCNLVTLHGAHTGMLFMSWPHRPCLWRCRRAAMEVMSAY